MRKCIVRVPSSMSSETFAYLSKRAEEKFGQDIEISRKNDDSLIGGFVLSLDGKVFDMSVASQLLLMKKHIRGD